jgi:hypothetical protein
MNAPTVDPAPADQLLVRINTAFAAVNEAEKTAETARPNSCHDQKRSGCCCLKQRSCILPSRTSWRS